MKINLSASWFYRFSLVMLLAMLYFFTLLPGPGYSGDTAKFQFVGYFSGTPHVTGYPTYVVLNYLFVKVFPFGTVAFKANLLSALFSVGASLVLFLTLRRVGIGTMISFVTTLTFGLGYTVWSQSIIAEVYSLNLLFISVVTYCLLRWHLERTDRFFYAACIFYAFSFGNHLTMINLLPAIVYLVWVTDRKTLVNPKKVGFVLLTIIIAATQYGYIFWRTQDPSTPYLETSASDPGSFLAAIWRGQFSNLLLGLPLWWMVSERFPALLMFIARESFFLLPFLFVGLRSFPEKEIGRFLLISFTMNFLFCLGYAIYDIFVYLVPSYFVLAFFSSRGLQATANALRGQFTFFTPALFMIIPVVVGFINLGEVNQRFNTADDEKVVQTLQFVDNNALVICPNYHYAMILWYHVFIEDWKSRNVHIAFFHDQRFPSAEIDTYLESQSPFIVPVSRDTVPPGLTAYLFLQSFDVGRYEPFSVGKTESTESKRSHESEVLRYKVALEKVGVQLHERRQGLYELRK